VPRRPARNKPAKQLDLPTPAPPAWDDCLVALASPHPGRACRGPGSLPGLDSAHVLGGRPLIQTRPPRQATQRAAWEAMTKGKGDDDGEGR
jgi:hypothetical protein